MKFGEWKIWNGGECPVADGTKVHVQFSHETRSDAILRTPSNAGSLEWEWISANSSGPFEIIAYRVAIEPVRETMTLYSAWHTGEFSPYFRLYAGCVTPRHCNGREMKMFVDLIDGIPDDTKPIRWEWME